MRFLNVDPPGQIDWAIAAIARCIRLHDVGLPSDIENRQLKIDNSLIKNAVAYGYVLMGFWPKALITRNSAVTIRKIFVFIEPGV